MQGHCLSLTPAQLLGVASEREEINEGSRGQDKRTEGLVSGQSGVTGQTCGERERGRRGVKLRENS